MSSEDSPVITTQGTGIITGAPDTVTIVLGVQTQAAQAAPAMAENAELANTLIQIKDQGVDDQDITTTNLSVQPNYQPAGTIDGYTVTNQVQATLRDIARSGDLIDAAAGAAGDAIRVQQLTFSIDDDSDLRAQARAEAVAEAQAQAQQIADAAGTQLGAVQSITENPDTGATPFPQARAMTDRAASTPIEPGSQELSVSVSVTYKIG
ncbi:hypothetical protein C3V38_05175 [Dietzia sp. oral taxon 368]|uniref:SIMPL domain-containing protein n=1 Tax=Dietzia sp. oral taxon 368 TaxID=712270 RepID=UPI000D08BC86|nr:SIMPL domain-containing protein [Dietzia sp. oral taxon 368]AVM63884.1 hypothetical protein C3V38_05175 [Dietzia sp. oral taxon 368]